MDFLLSFVEIGSQGETFSPPNVDLSAQKLGFHANSITSYCIPNTGSTGSNHSSATESLLEWKMPEIQLGAHTIRSHGVHVAKISYAYDWLILMLLVVIGIVLNLIEPFHRFVGKDMMTYLMCKFEGNTVPFSAVPLDLHINPHLPSDYINYLENPIEMISEAEKAAKKDIRSLMYFTENLRRQYGKGPYLMEMLLKKLYVKRMAVDLGIDRIYISGKIVGKKTNMTEKVFKAYNF